MNEPSYLSLGYDGYLNYECSSTRLFTRQLLRLRSVYVGPMASRTPTPLPRITPIVPVLRPAPFNNSAWLFEPKYDGFRGIVYLILGSCAIYSKRGDRFSRFREIEDQLCSVFSRRELDPRRRSRGLRCRRAGQLLGVDARHWNAGLCRIRRSVEQWIRAIASEACLLCFRGRPKEDTIPVRQNEYPTTC